VSAAVEVPIAEEADRVCAALAIEGPRCARRLLDMLDPADVYYPRHRRIIEHALDAEVLQAEDADDPREARVVALAKTAGVDLYYLRELLEESSLGWWRVAPRLVTEAARRREAMELARAIYNSSGQVDAKIVGRLGAIAAELQQNSGPALVAL